MSSFTGNTFRFVLVGSFALLGCSDNNIIPLQFEKGVQDVIAKSRSAVVIIEAYASHPGGVPVQTPVRIAGVVIDQEGTVVTTCEALRYCDSLTVLFQDGCAVGARKSGSDAETNIALLKTETHTCGCFPIPTSMVSETSSGKMAILLNNSSVSKGIAAGLGITADSWLGGDDPWSDPLMIIQTGDILAMTGAPVVSLEGNLVGICDAMIEAHHGAWTVIRAKTILRVASELKNRKSIPRGWIGIGCSIEEGEPIEKSLVKPNIRIAKVIEGSPAELVNLKTGDIISSINGNNIYNIDSLRKIISNSVVGAELTIGIKRNGTEIDPVNVITIALPDDSQRPRLCKSRTL